MSSISIGESFIDGLRAPSYTNGRLLTADDLKTDQETLLKRLGLMGEALGAGVVRGFEVSKVSNNLKVSAGLGLNRAGQVVRLAGDDVELSLSTVHVSETGSAAGDGLFKACSGGSVEGGALVESGIYLLAAAPVSKSEGAVSVKTISTNTATCAKRWEVEGVRFKVMRLPNAPVYDESDSLDLYRNQLAHWCFATGANSDPLSIPSYFAPLETPGESELTLCDLPLALFYWKDSALHFVDQWSARRRISPELPSTLWQGLIADRRVADGQARFLQFQAQIEEMLDGTGFTSRYGGDDFRYLPPVGILPITLPDDLFQTIWKDIEPIRGRPDYRGGKLVTGGLRSRTTRTFTLEKFFADKLPADIGLIDLAGVDALLNRSWYEEPLDFTKLPDVQEEDDKAPFDLYVLVGDDKAPQYGVFARKAKTSRRYRRFLGGR